MKGKAKTLMLIIALGSLCSFPAAAVTTSIWRETEQAQFDKGKLRGVSTNSNGEVILGPAVERVYDSAQLYIWSLAVDAKGIVYAGSGNNGGIYKFEQGRGSLLYDSPEVAINSLVLDKKGNLYAGSSPRGIIYKISLKKGEAKIFVDLDEEYIWALAFDGRGNLYAGTGQRGRIYRISPKGKVEIFYDSPESHILSLVFDKQGNLYAGSEGQGIIYKINPEGKTFALYDPPQGEVHTLAIDSRNNLYAGALEKEAVTVPSPGDSSLPFLSHQGDKKNAEKVTVSLVYKITPDGTYREWFRCPDPLILSMIVDDKDNLYLGTGNRGLIYKIDPEGEAVTLLKASEPQILSMTFGGKDFIYFGSGNLGRLYAFSPVSYAGEGTLESQVYDASFITRWGNISYKGKMPPGTMITLATRSGNTERPGDTWSAWSKEYGKSQGEPVTSPPARFIQYRARLSTRDEVVTPVVEEVSLAFLPGNQAPEITALKVSKPGSEQGGNKKEGGSRSFPRGDKSGKERSRTSEMTVSWKAADPNDDALLYDLYFRGEGEKNWKELKKEIRKTSYVWDSLTFPDGIYLIKLIASDSPDNPSAYALTDEEVSPPFLIDNTRPVVENLKVTLSGRTAVIRGEAIDNLSYIKRIEYSVDAGSWVPIYPLDEIFDSLREPFEVSVSELLPGEHTIVLKVTDEAGNVGASKAVILRNRDSED